MVPADTAMLESSSRLDLRGPRVLLKEFTEADITDAYIGWLNDPKVIRYSNNRFATHDRASCVRYLQSFAGTSNLFVVVRRLDTDQTIGTMTAYVSNHHGTVDVGIMMGDPSIWGCGYGQEAWNTLTNWLLQRPSIRKLTAGTVACNIGMVRLMERSGMHLEATRKQQELIEGRPEDILHFARFRNA